VSVKRPNKPRSLIQCNAIKHTNQPAKYIQSQVMSCPNPAKKLIAFDNFL